MLCKNGILEKGDPRVFVEMRLAHFLSTWAFFECKIGNISHVLAYLGLASGSEASHSYSFQIIEFEVEEIVFDCVVNPYINIFWTYLYF